MYLVLRYVSCFSLSSQQITTNEKWLFICLYFLSGSTLNSRNRNIYAGLRYIMPYFAPVYQSPIYCTTVLPWQMNRIFIIVFFLLKCLVLPYFTHFFGFIQELQFSESCSKSGKIRQFETKCSSLQQSIGSQFRGCRLPGFLNLLTISPFKGVHFQK